MLASRLQKNSHLRTNNVLVTSLVFQTHISGEETTVFEHDKTPPCAMMKVAEIASIEMKIAQARVEMVF